MKRIITGFILGVLITGTIGVMAANTISSSIVTYNNKTVEKSLDELYEGYNKLKSTGDASASQVLFGKSAMVKGTEIVGTMDNYSGKYIWINGDNGKFSDNYTYTYTSGYVTNQMVGYASNRWYGYFDSTTVFIFGKRSDIADLIKCGKTFLGGNRNVLNNY